MNSNGRNSPLRESEVSFEMRSPGTVTRIKANYVSKLVMERTLPSQSGKGAHEQITLRFSAPSSGQQVTSIRRSLSYYAEIDQPRISELIAQLSQKMKTQPQTFQYDKDNRYLFQFSKGEPFLPKVRQRDPQCHAHTEIPTEEHVSSINKDGTCSIAMFLFANFGMSRDNARSLTFTLADNDRVKSTAGADYAFFNDYLRSLQERTKGNTPKL